MQYPENENSASIMLKIISTYVMLISANKNDVVHHTSHDQKEDLK